MWQDGPEWLRTGIERNQSLLDTDISDEYKVELKTANKDTPLHVLLTQQTGWIGHIVDSERYSTTHRLYRVTATILKFIQLLKRQVTSPKLAEEDVAKAEELWIRESPSGVMRNDRFPTWKNQFGLFQDERLLWRCGGRLQNADLPYSAIHPILLDGRHHHTALVIRDALATTEYGKH